MTGNNPISKPSKSQPSSAAISTIHLPRAEGASRRAGSVGRTPTTSAPGRILPVSCCSIGESAFRGGAAQAGVRSRLTLDDADAFGILKELKAGRLARLHVETTCGAQAQAQSPPTRRRRERG